MANDMENSHPRPNAGAIEPSSSVAELEPRTRGLQWASIIRLISMLLIVGALVTMVRSLPFDQAMSAMKDWIGGLGVWGPVVLVLLYIVATVLFVPGTILTLAAGAIFGLALGTVTVSIGSTLGACAAFLIARYGAREKVAKMAQGNRHFSAIDRAIAEGGWKIVGLLRLSPAIPFNLQNYLYGLTPVKFWPYAVTSWIAMLPGTFLYVYLGHVTGAAIGGERERSAAEWAMLAVGLLATVVVTVYVTRLANRKLKEQVDEPHQDDLVTSSIEEVTNDKPAPSLRRTVILAGVAIVLVAAAAYVRLNAGEIESKWSRLFGPPQVEMREAYAGNASSTKVDHAVLNQLLQRHVDRDGWVDYEALQSDEDQLDAYLDIVADAPFERLGRDEKLALLINGYNAATLKLILDHWPVESIMDIAESQRWDAERWQVGGHTWSLSQIEHEQIRPKFAEPRVHFALVCAAVGCPPLRNEAYDAGRLEEQLQEQTEYVHQHATWFRFAHDPPTLQLTKLYNWYGGDFEQSAGSVPAFATRYSPSLRKAFDAGAVPTLQWLPYDWSLNSRQNKQPR